MIPSPQVEELETLLCDLFIDPKLRSLMCGGVWVFSSRLLHNLAHSVNVEIGDQATETTQGAGTFN